MNAPSQRISDSQRRSFNGGSDARIIMGDDDSPPLHLRQEKRGETKPEDLSGTPRACAKPSASPIGTAHAEFVAVLDGHPPRTIPLEADAIDLEDRAEHLGKVFGALSVYLAVILDDTAQNVPSRLDLPNIEVVLADLAADVTGAIQHAAEDMAGWIA